MRVPKNRLRSAVGFFLLSAALLSTLPSPALADGRKDAASFDRLAQKAWREGKVRVIVHLDVPQIEELTAASAQYRNVDTDLLVARDRIAADQALTDAIDYMAWKVLMELQGMEPVVITKFKYIPYIALHITPTALAVLRESPSVLGVEEDLPDKLVEPVPDPTGSKGDPATDNNEKIEPPLLTTTADLVGATTAWGWGYTGSGWYVAILDTGIRKTHQFFSGKNIVEGCFAMGSDGSTGSGDCPNGQSSMTGNGSAVHYSSSHSGYDHGTHVAGIASGNYGSMAGIAKNANIIAVQVFSKFTSTSDCGSSAPCVLSWNSDQLRGLEHIYSLRGSYNIGAVNMSIGGGRYSSTCDSDSRKSAIDNLRSVNIAVAIATGNNGYCGSVGSPSCISSSVAVGSSTKSDLESSFNNWHSTMQRLYGPGSSINSSTGASDSSYASWNGTSMATPHITGAWALIRQAFPSLSVSDALNALRTTGKSITSVCNSYASPGIPRIRVDLAIASLGTLVQRQLNILAGTGGTTIPAPGLYLYALDSNVSVTGVGDSNHRFNYWEGDVSGTTNPVTVKMDRDKTVKANFLRMYYLTLTTSAGGTTAPVSGTYRYDTGTSLQITATPSTYNIFIDWSGSATGSANPLTVVMTSDKAIKSNFRYIYEPAVTGRKVLNRSFSQAEYINIISWVPNAANDGLDIAKYRIYLVRSGSPAQLLYEADSTDREFRHRMAGEDPLEYYVAAVTSSGREGAPGPVTISK